MTAHMKLAEYQDAIAASGGSFRCPLCGKVSTTEDFREAGADPQRAAQECIGRVVGAAGGLKSDERPVPQPCDWAAFGLFRTLDGGVLVAMPDGSEVAAFEPVVKS